MTLTIQDLDKSFGGRLLFRNFSLTVEEGTVTCLLGPSGCGKTTLLNMISRVIPADSGDFRQFEGKRVSCIFQEPRLLPWQTVSGNLNFVLRDRFPRQERDRLVSHWVEKVGLKGYENEFPKNLSGGMKQRVAIARAFAFPSDILLMDEPFKGLDVKLKTSIMELFLLAWQENPRTVIFVTHDIDEALLLGQRVCVLSHAPVTVTKDIQVSGRLQEGMDDFQREAVLREIKEELLEALPPFDEEPEGKPGAII